MKSIATQALFIISLLDLLALATNTLQKYLENHVLVTENGYENLSPWTLDLGRFELL